VAWITINRPDKMNAFRGQTCDEIIKALNKAGYDRDVGCIVLAGAGDKAFCTGGDQSAHDGNYDGRGTIGLPMEELHTAIRDVPKPVIARVQGYAIGGGNVLATICDLTICPTSAILGQVAQDGLGRPRLRHGLSGPRGGREEGARDLVPEQALLGQEVAMGLANTACRTTSWTPRCRSGPRPSASAAPPPLPSPSAASTWTRPTRRALPAWACTR
jgi:2-ketocyclohexanecarboxyl-CoA hydrolase